MAVAFSWTGYVDTDLAFSEFFNGDHTITLRYMPQYPKGYEGPCVAENGTGTFAIGQGPVLHSAGRLATAAHCPRCISRWLIIRASSKQPT